MISFDAAHGAVHYPKDRRFRIWIRPYILIGIAVAVSLAVLAAWIEVAVAGLPHIPTVPQIYPNNFAGPHGFPLWVRYCHFFNFFFVMLLIRSGLSILVDHPRLYFNDDCTPGSEWIRFTPVKVPRDRLWTAKDDARYISPLVGTPGYRHTIGIARVWHFINVHGFIVTGHCLRRHALRHRAVAADRADLFGRASCRGGTPSCTMPHCTCRAEPNGFYGYNALQQIAYFSVFFIFGPLAILTGIAMSPAVVNHFPWYARLFGGRQSARSIHFLNMLGFLGFIVVHVTLVVMTGFARNMNHIVMGTDDQSSSGLWWGFVGIGVVVLSWVVAHYLSWNKPRGLQHALKSVTYPMQLITLNRLRPRQGYSDAQISPYFWPNGKMPVREDWKHLAANDFRDFRLKVGGLVENPVDLSLAEIEKLGHFEDVTMHHCIQGWTGIAKWGGLPMKTLIDLVRPKPEAKVVAFFSFGGALYGGAYYDTQTHGERSESGMPARLTDERAAASRGIWRSTAAARRESTWLQDGQVDRAH